MAWCAAPETRQGIDAVYSSRSPRAAAHSQPKLQSCADTYCERILGRIPEDRREDVVHALRVLVDAIDDLPAM